MRKTVALLDVDGTLIDSNPAHAQSWVETFAHFGYEVAYERVRRLIGKGGDRLLPEAIGIEKDSSLGEEITKFRSGLFAKTYLPELRAFPFARELLEALEQNGLKLVVASSASAKELTSLLEAAQLDDLLTERTSSSDAKESKPAPDIVIAALGKAGCKPGEAVMLGDTPWDVQAARRAGVAIVAVRCGGWEDAELEGALAVYADPKDLLQNLQDSPFITK